MEDLSTLGKLRRNVSYGVTCQEQFRDALKHMGKKIFEKTVEKEKKDASGRIIVDTTFEQSVTLAEKLDILGPIMANEDKKNLKQQLRASVLVLFQDVMLSIGVLTNEAKNNVKIFLRREEPSYDGINPLERDRTRKANISKLNLALDIVSGTKFYSSTIKETIDLEKKWRKFPRSKEMLENTPQDWDLCTELASISDARNVLGSLSKKSIPDEAEIKFSVSEHVKEAMTCYSP